MKYIELKIKTDREYLEQLQAVLIGAGFSAMQIDDPLDALDIAEHPDLYKYDYINEEISQTAAGAEAGSSDAVTVILFFEDDEEGRAQHSKAESLLGHFRAYTAGGEAGGLTSTYDKTRISWESSTTGDDSEWLYKWQEHFKPAKVGRRIVVKPGWENYEPAEGELVIEMDPGMAFGSGLHETTSMCVKALEKVLADDGGVSFGSKTDKGKGRPGMESTQSGSVKRILDVGTGTGILAMAAVLLGADEALGIDIDDEAVRVAAENIDKNGMADKIQICKGDLMAGVDYEPDVIVANLMADLVVKLSPAAAAQLRPGGIYITSGILDIKEETVKSAIENAGFEVIEVLADGEWRAIAAVRR